MTATNLYSRKPIPPFFFEGADPPLLGCTRRVGRREQGAKDLCLRESSQPSIRSGKEQPAWTLKWAWGPWTAGPQEAAAYGCRGIRGRELENQSIVYMFGVQR